MVLGQIVTRIEEVVSGMNLLRHGWTPINYNKSGENVGGNRKNSMYEPLQEEKEEELALGETNIDKQLQIFNDILVNYCGWWTYGKKGPSLGMTNIIQCQLCRSKEHITFVCFRFINLKPKCAKCGGGA